MKAGRSLPYMGCPGRIVEVISRSGRLAGVRLPERALNPEATASAACPQVGQHAIRWGQFVDRTLSGFHAVPDKLTPATPPQSGRRAHQAPNG